MRRYFRNLAATPEAAGTNVAALDMLRLVLGPGLFENARDDLIQRRLLHVHVEHCVLLEDGAHHFGHAGAFDA